MIRIELSQDRERRSNESQTKTLSVFKEIAKMALNDSIVSIEKINDNLGCVLKENVYVSI